MNTEPKLPEGTTLMRVVESADSTTVESNDNSSVSGQSSPSNQDDDVDDILHEAKMNEEELIMLSIPDLNTRLKQANISKEDKVRLKARRRTLKNRGYASSSRLKRSDRCKEYERREREADEEVKQLKAEYEEMIKEIEQLEQIVGKDHSDEESEEDQ